MEHASKPVLGPSIPVEVIKITCNDEISYNISKFDSRGPIVYFMSTCQALNWRKQFATPSSIHWTHGFGHNKGFFALDCWTSVGHALAQRQRIPVLVLKYRTEPYSLPPITAKDYR